MGNVGDVSMRGMTAMTNSLTSFGDIVKYAAMGETAYKDSAECPQQFLRAPKGEGRLPDLF